ncbi:MAG: alpha-L-glutamate ligase-like protein [Desulfobacteraceae bacterium]|nr:alpha-L-glutamate ligase-like protein [Desulfobacteraceae bacterium]
MWIFPFALRKQGFLGMNRRNVDYVSRYNSRSRYPLVDNKLKTKLLAEKFSLSMPRLRGVIRYQYETAAFADLVENLDGFAIKPAKGTGGKGILVIKGRSGDRFVKSSGRTIGIEEIKRHLSNILAGLYSLAGTPDVAIIEDLIRPVEMFEQLSYTGVPDIRIIVFKGYPVMAMMRLSTRASDGKANLHKGAVGVGLDIATGRCLHAVQYSRRVTRHPDTDLALDALAVPDWQNLLVLAARSFELTRLGYIGADLVVDKNRGPFLLELNARPGLSIQIANGTGLLPRLEKIEQLDPDLIPEAEKRVAFAMGAFCSGNF